MRACGMCGPERGNGGEGVRGDRVKCKTEQLQML